MKRKLAQGEWPDVCRFRRRGPRVLITTDGAIKRLSSLTGTPVLRAEADLDVTREDRLDDT